MKIAGLQNLSLVDFPGHLASVIFVQGCNFKCGYCQNPDLIPLEASKISSEKDIIDIISVRTDMIEGIVISGGEPSIYKDLSDIIRQIKDMGFLVKLDTNGSNPSQLEDLLRKWLLDYIAMDIKTALSKYSLITDQKNIAKVIAESVGLTILSTAHYEFRTTCVPGLVDEKDFKEIGAMVKGAKKYYLQQFRPTITYDKTFQNVKPYGKKDLQKFKSILEEFVETVEIRGV